MKKFLRFTAVVIAGILIIAMAASIVGASVTESRSGTVNNKPGEITNEELRTFFNENRALLQDIATQLIPLHEETELYLIHKKNGKIVAQDGITVPIALDAKLMQQLEQYFSAAGTANEPTISLGYPLFSGIPAVFFEFRLAVGVTMGIMYSTCAETQGNWEEGSDYERMDTEWAIYGHMMTAAIEPPCWEKLPAWLQWILRYIFFGWIWMK